MEAHVVGDPQPRVHLREAGDEHVHLEAWVKAVTPLPRVWVGKADPHSRRPIGVPSKERLRARLDASSSWSARRYSTVTVLARFRGWSTFRPRSRAIR